MSCLGWGGYSSITLEQILEHRTPAHVANLIHKELPLRFATRVRQIECTTPEWRTIPGMLEVHSMLSTSFRNLRLVDFNASELAEFTEVIKDLRERHKPVVPLIARAARGLTEREILSGRDVDAWLHKFLNSRMGTEMLTAHYVSLLTAPGENHVGIVDTKCDPARICRNAIDHVKSLFTDSGVGIHLQVEEDHDLEFSFITKYLFFVVEELLKNSICATLARAAQRGEEPTDIYVTVCADASHIGIKISDKGGGVPFEQTESIWKYMFSTTPEDLQSQFTEETPLSGPGMGLPLCRLYVQYLGGSLHLMSMPEVGADVYMFLNRIDAGTARLADDAGRSGEDGGGGGGTVAEEPRA